MEVTGQESRFRAMFAEEAEGRLATLSELLLELERNGGDQELLSSVFREAHTLKGAAAVVGLADVLRVAHAMEEILEGLRRGDASATPELVDALLGAVDGMREMVPAVLAGDARGDHADRLVATLRHPPTAPVPPVDNRRTAAPDSATLPPGGLNPAPGRCRAPLDHHLRCRPPLDHHPRRRPTGAGAGPSGCRWSGWTTWSGWWARRRRPPCGSGGWSPTSSAPTRPACPSWVT